MRSHAKEPPRLLACAFNSPIQKSHPMGKVRSLRNVSALLFVPGAILNLVAYQSIAPLPVFLIFLGITILLLKMLDKGGVHERTAVLLVSTVCWLWAGIAAIYLRYLSESAWGPDAPRFYETITSGEVAFEDGAAIIQYAGAVAIWRLIYDFFAILGFGKAEYIGVTANIVFVSLTGMLGVKMVETTFGCDYARIRRFTIIYASCGIFWLFAATHIRDSIALFLVTLLSLFWVHYLALPNIRTRAQLILATVAGFLFFDLVRGEFIYVPVAMLLAGITANIVGKTEGMRRRKILLISILVFLPIAGFLLSFMYDDIFNALSSGGERYDKSSVSEGGGLGNQLIVTAPIALRLILGSAYVFLFPVPFWVGFLPVDGHASAYHLFKSFHAMFMYGVTPLFGLALWRLSVNKALRTPVVLFLVFSVIGFTVSVVLTSLEGRHFGAFLVPLLVLSVLPDLQKDADRNAYKFLLYVVLGGMLSVHLAWGLIKLIT